MWNLFRRFSLAILLLLFFALPASASEWESKGESKGVQLYEGSGERFGGLAFRGILETDLGIDKILPVFVDPDERPNWLHRFGEEEMIEKKGDPSSMRWTELVYSRIHLPFPASDRDHVFETTYEIDEAKKRVVATIRTIEDDRYPERDCCVRARSFTRYILTPRSNGGTRIEIEVETDLRGRLPSRITRGAQREWPTETLVGLVDRARQADRSPDPRVAGW